MDKNCNTILGLIITNTIISAVLLIIMFLNYEMVYKDGYTQALTNQDRGAVHEYVLKENKNGELEWVTNHEKTYHTKLTWRKKK